MQHEIAPLHAQRIERPDHTALLLNAMYDKDRNHICKQHHNQDTEHISALYVDLLVIGSPSDPRVILRGEKQREVRQLRVIIFQKIVRLRL